MQPNAPLPDVQAALWYESPLVWQLLLPASLFLGLLGSLPLWVNPRLHLGSADVAIERKLEDHLGPTRAVSVLRDRLSKLPETSAVLFLGPSGDWTATEVYDAVRYLAWPREVVRANFDPRTGRRVAPLNAGPPRARGGSIEFLVAYRARLPDTQPGDMEIERLGPHLAIIGGGQ